MSLVIQSVHNRSGDFTVERVRNALLEHDERDFFAKQFGLEQLSSASQPQQASESPPISILENNYNHENLCNADNHTAQCSVVLLPHPTKTGDRSLLDSASGPRALAASYRSAVRRVALWLRRNSQPKRHRVDGRCWSARELMQYVERLVTRVNNLAHLDDELARVVLHFAARESAQLFDAHVATLAAPAPFDVVNATCARAERAAHSAFARQRTRGVLHNGANADAVERLQLALDARVLREAKRHRDAFERRCAAFAETHVADVEQRARDARRFDELDRVAHNAEDCARRSWSSLWRAAGAALQRRPGASARRLQFALHMGGSRQQQR